MSSPGPLGGTAADSPSYLGLISPDAPPRCAAAFHVISPGYSDGPRYACTVSLAIEGGVRVVIDPGMVPTSEAILDPLANLRVTPDTVTDVVFSACTPTHSLNAALFPRARFHGPEAIYQGDTITNRPADGYLVSPSIRLLLTGAPTPGGITTLVATRDGVVVCTHLWSSTPGQDEDDPVANSPLHAGRRRVLPLAHIIVPGHGPQFRAGPDLPA